MENKSVIGIVNYNKKVLIGKKNSNSPKKLAGLWHLPGETKEEDETDEQTLKRGFKQEANLEITVGKYLGYSITSTSKANWYECFSETDEIQAGSDLEKIKWINKGEVFNYLDKESLRRFPERVKRYFIRF